MSFGSGISNAVADQIAKTVIVLAVSGVLIGLFVGWLIWG
jgi:F0F1-type ATP synthase assembly protein I